MADNGAGNGGRIGLQTTLNILSTVSLALVGWLFTEQLEDIDHRAATRGLRDQLEFHFNTDDARYAVGNQRVNALERDVSELRARQLDVLRRLDQLEDRER